MRRKLFCNVKTSIIILLSAVYVLTIYYIYFIYMVKFSFQHSFSHQANFDGRDIDNASDTSSNENKPRTNAKSNQKNSVAVPRSSIFDNITEPVQDPDMPPSHCTSQDLSLPVCPAIPTHLLGRLSIDVNPPSSAQMSNVSEGVGPGGAFMPHHCRPKDKVAIVVPYRSREIQLLTFLHHMHPILMRQEIQYQVVLVNQAGNNTFNRAMLFNIGFVEAMKLCHFDCFVFHDVDLLAEDDRNLYTCPDQPRHLSVSINKFSYKLLYSRQFGGAGMLTTQHFKLVNGFSNKYWGWGGEDDNMSDRIRYHNLTIIRYKENIARYTMINHTTEVTNAANVNRFKLLNKTRKKYDHNDGLSNLQYKLISLEFKNLYTNITVTIDKIRHK